MSAFQRLKFLVKSDLHRHTGETNLYLLVVNLFRNPGFQYSFYLRLCNYAKDSKNLPLFIFAKLWLEHYSCKYGIIIPYNTQIDSGFYIGHFSCIAVNRYCKIGKNCNISQGVTLGQANRGKNKGYPTIGDNVYLGPGVKVVGNVKIGNNVAIGANCVVTSDIPDNAVVVGIPGRVISYDGATDYISRTNYA